MEKEDVLIIGAGPAGIAAAFQLKRYDMDPLIIEKHEVGGLLRNANKIENFPGFPGGISGPELVKRMKHQLEFHRIRVRKEEVLSVDFHRETFRVRSTNNAYNVKILIIASGTRTKTIDIDIPMDCRSLMFSEIHPLLDCTEKKFAIVGGGDAAFDYALNLANKNSVLIFNRSDRKKCLPLLSRETAKNKHITIMERIRIHTLSRIGDRLQLECIMNTGNRDQIEHRGSERKADRESEIGEGNAVGNQKLEVDYLIFAIGREPELAFMDQILLERRDEMQEKGLLYIIGDVKNGVYRQAVIAAGDGVRAAMMAHERLMREH